MTVAPEILESFHRVLVEEIRQKRPEYLKAPFTVAEIYQDLTPYPTHRGRIGVDMNGDYEDALIRLLAGEGGYLILESEHALRQLRVELQSKNPNTGVYREFAAVDVRLAPAMVEQESGGGAVLGAVASGSSPSPSEPAASGEVGLSASAPARTGQPSVTSGTASGAKPSGGRTSGSAPEAGREAGKDPAHDGSACVWCEAPLPSRVDLKFCPFCGMDVHLVPCAGCGQELEPDWRFCIACGTGRPS